MKLNKDNFTELLTLFKRLGKSYVGGGFLNIRDKTKGKNANAKNGNQNQNDNQTDKD